MKGDSSKKRENSNIFKSEVKQTIVNAKLAPECCVSQDKRKHDINWGFRYLKWGGSAQ